MSPVLSGQTGEDDTVLTDEVEGASQVLQQVLRVVGGVHEFKYCNPLVRFWEFYSLW